MTHIIRFDRQQHQQQIQELLKIFLVWEQQN